MAKAKTKQQLTIENEELQARLQELEDTLEAIRSGAVDAIVTSGPAGDQVYTLEGADHAYHMMVESMNEGAVTLLPDGTILYGNRQFGQMTGASPSEIVGRRFHDFVHASDRLIIGRIHRSGRFRTARRRRSCSAMSRLPRFPYRFPQAPIDLGGAKAIDPCRDGPFGQKTLRGNRRRGEAVPRILEQAQEAIAVCIDGCIVRANRALYEICGRIP